MNEDINNLFTLPVLDRFLVYNPLNGRYALLNHSGVRLLKDAILGQAQGPIPEEFSGLVGLLTAPGETNPAKTGPLDPKFLGIIPSRACNMSCAYCDFGAHQNDGTKLDAGQMVAAIDWYVQHRKNSGRRTLPIQFFGGEPFVERELVDIAVHHARFVASRNGLVPQFEALTNGYIGENQRRFIKDYFDRIIVSLDGFRPFHDRTRAAVNAQSSFDRVVDTIHSLCGQNLQLSIRCCVTAESVHEMENMAGWFCGEFQPDIVNFETLMQNPNTRAAGLLPPGPYEFAVHCVKSRRVLRDAGVEPAYAPVSPDQPQTTSCPVGRDVLIVHPNGKIAGCYVQEKDWRDRGMDLTVGAIENGRIQLDENKIIAFRHQLETKTRCRNCFCRYGCAGGCHVNNTFPGCSEQYVDFCIHTRIITLCRLLEDMGEQQLADRFLDDKDGMQKMALLKSDRLRDFEHGYSI